MFYGKNILISCLLVIYLILIPWLYLLTASTLVLFIFGSIKLALNSFTSFLSLVSSRCQGKG